MKEKRRSRRKTEAEVEATSQGGREPAGAGGAWPCPPVARGLGLRELSQDEFPLVHAPSAGD